MSIKTLITKILDQIKSIFIGMPIEIRSAASIAVVVVENLKTVIENPAIDVLTAVIPGNLDNTIVNCLRNCLPNILTDLRLIDNTIEPIDDQTKVASATKIIQNLNGNIKSAFLHDLAILIAQELAKLANNTLSWTDAVYVMEWYYQHEFKKV